MKEQKNRVVKSLEHIIKKNNNTHDILKLSIETNSKSKKRYTKWYYDEEEISIGNSILFENEEEDIYCTSDSDFSEMPELEEIPELEEGEIYEEGEVYAYYSSGDYIQILPNLGTNV